MDRGCDVGFRAIFGPELVDGGIPRASRSRENRAEVERESTNVRNGTRSKTVICDAVGEVDINVPRDREHTFEPQIVKKRQRRLADVDEVVLSLHAKGLTTGEISAHFAEIYGASVSKETVSRARRIVGACGHVTHQRAYAM